MLFLFILVLASLIRLYQIDSLPGEVWGDVITHYQLVLRLYGKQFFLAYPFYGDGPFFSYFAAFLSLFLGLSFLTLKLATVIGGVTLTAVTYFLSKELFHKREIALMASLITAVSFWSVSFSRQAKPHIFVPVFVALALLFALRNKRILSGVMLGLGMYVQAGFWGTMLVFFTNVWVLVVGIIVAAPVLFTFFSHYENFFSGNGFYAEKLGSGADIHLLDRFSIYGENIVKNFLSFYTQGDVVFRHNIPTYPHIDIVSTIFFTIGFVFIIKLIITSENNRVLQYFLLPFFLIQIPSLADVTNPESVPNMGRMIGILPLVYIAIAYGISISFASLRKHYYHKFFLGFFLGLIIMINLYNYFIIYPRGLPNGNIPFGKLITSYINTEHDSPLVFLSGCCWGEWGQPEPNGIRLNLRHPEKMYEISRLKSLDEMCSIGKAGDEFVVVVDPSKAKKFVLPGDCMRKKNVFMMRERELDVGWIIEGEFK